MEEAAATGRKVLEGEEILERLTVRQFVSPHQAVLEAMKAAGICGACSERALGWLGVPPELSIGRLRRTELTQLARATGRMLRVQAASRARTAP